MKGAIFTPAEVKAPAPAPAPAKKAAAKKAPVRARESDGQYKADNPATPDVDEAWEQPQE